MTLETPSDQPPVNGSIDAATLELLASWRRQDATDDPEEIRAAEQELAEFKKAMNDARILLRRAPPLPVSRFLFLDSGPLGLITHPQRTEEVIVLNERLALWLLNGNLVVVPAIVY